MEALTINRADLSTIEQNMQTIATELSKVINNVNNMNTSVSNIGNKVGTLDSGLESVIEEIKSNTIVNNARQNIMFNNAIIDKKYGYHDILRRNLESLIEALLYSKIEVKTIKKLRDNILVNNPRYWLSNATLSIIYWLLNDKEKQSIELNNALRKDKSKTSMFFILINKQFKRDDASIHWLKYYLNNQDPTELNEDFIVVLDLISNGLLGIEGEHIIINKINEWLPKINTNIKTNQIDNWKKYINSLKRDDYNFNKINNYASNDHIIKNNLSIIETYNTVTNDIDNIINKKNKEIELDKIIYNLIYDYEIEEKVYKEDNIKNELLISCNGNKELAEKLYKEKINSINNKYNLLDLFYEIINYKDKYNITTNTSKIAFYYQKEYLIKAYEEINKTINQSPLAITIDDFKTTSKDGKNKEEISKQIELYINNKYQDNNNSILIILIIINILGLIGIIATTSNSIINTIILILLAIINIILLFKIKQKENNLLKEKERYKKLISDEIESSLAEITEYDYIISNNKHLYDVLINKINSIKIENLITNKERRLDIDE